MFIYLPTITTFQCIFLLNLFALVSQQHGTNTMRQCNMRQSPAVRTCHTPVYYCKTKMRRILLKVKKCRERESNQMRTQRTAGQLQVDVGMRWIRCISVVYQCWYFSYFIANSKIAQDRIFTEIKFPGNLITFMN